MILKSGNRLSEKDHAPTKGQNSGMDKARLPTTE